MTNQKLLACIDIAWRPRPSHTLGVEEVIFWLSESYDMNNSYSGHVVALKYWNKNGGGSAD